MKKSIVLLLIFQFAVTWVTAQGSDEPLIHEVIKINKQTLKAESNFPIDRSFYIEIPEGINVPSSAKLYSARRVANYPKERIYFTQITVSDKLIQMPQLMPRREYEIRWYEINEKSYSEMLKCLNNSADLERLVASSKCGPENVREILADIKNLQNSRTEKKSQIRNICEQMKVLEKEIYDIVRPQSGSNSSLTNEQLVLQSKANLLVRNMIYATTTSNGKNLENWINSIAYGVTEFSNSPSISEEVNLSNWNFWQSIIKIKTQIEQLELVKNQLLLGLGRIQLKDSQISDLCGAIEQYILGSKEFISSGSKINEKLLSFEFENFFVKKVIRGSTMQTNYDTRVSQYIQSDVSFIFAYGSGDLYSLSSFHSIVPAYISRLSLFPIDNRYPLKYTSHYFGSKIQNKAVQYGMSLVRRSTLDLGLTIGDISSNQSVNTITNLWGNYNVVVGYGFRISNGFSIGGGAMIHRMYTNPVFSDLTETTWSPYLNCSINLKLDKIIAPFTARLFS